MKTKSKFSVLFFLISFLIIGGLVFDAHNYAPNRLKLTQYNLTHEKLNADYQQLKIAFFGDVHFGPFLNTSRFELFITKLAEAQPDIVIFLGDLFDENYEPSEAELSSITTGLKSILAPRGKFAILGDEDLSHPTLNNQVTEILFQSGFEVLTNENRKLYSGSEAVIQLVGLENMLNSTIDVETAFAGINPNLFTLVISHTPDSSQLIPLEKADYFLAAQSQYYQVNFPWFKTESSNQGNAHYPLGQTQQNQTVLHLTTGWGSKNKDVRFFSTPEIIIYQLP